SEAVRDGEPAAASEVAAADGMAETPDAEPADLFPDETPPQEAAGPSLGTWSSVGGGGGASGEDYNLEAFVAVERTLKDHLAEQLAIAAPDPMQRLIGHALIELLDEAGYLREPLEPVAERLGASLAEVEAALAMLQGFEPVGVAARSLAECLALQLKERDRFDPAMQALVANLELVARRDYAALRRVCGVADDDLADMLDEIRHLNPKPGIGFGGAPAQPVEPDVLVRSGPNGDWIVELNADTLPRVLVNQSYYARVSRSPLRPEERAYLSECLQTANWLTKSLDQRARTILKVATEIVRRQDAFLLQGIAHLRPLNLRMVADAIGMHESTVSRVTANKYMATPRGLFEMKYFFTAAISSADGGEAHSAEAVRHRIKLMIDAEPPDDALSDDTIVQRLREGGIDIARRTVAKYREAMNIPSSVQRRRDKRLAVTRRSVPVAAN
ncbi:MAG: RNA polymerase factor sigma-54, partial [Pseudomonadota bacterium]|nr:RNA polymerase factor sigma-54 [Pseudomonadota bacterium]